MRQVIRLAVALTVAVGLCVSPSTASAQAVSGTLLGNITDSSGGAVPGATVTATEADTNVGRSTVSNESGHYTFSSLVNGRYIVSAELQGFKKAVHQNVKVDVNSTIRLDMTLEVGAMTEAVTVAAETPVLQTDRTDTGRIIGSKMITDMPLTFNRNFQSLMITVPGATRPHREHSQFFNSQDSLRFEVNGQPGMASNTLIEGLDDNQKTGLLQVIIPAADALETVSVSTSNYDAEFGRSGGAITNVTIRSGTNQVRGSGFVFANNEKTNAGDYFNHQKAPTKFLNTGFTLGGPIVHNKLFFFGDYQRTIDNNGYVVRATVPTVQMRNGDFTQVANGIYDPLTGALNGTGRAAFDGNIIPQNRISPVAQKLIAFIPLPNIPGAGLGQNNYQKSQVRQKTTDGFDVKVNHTLNQRDQLSYRTSFMRPVVFDPGLYGIYGGPANSGFAGTGTNNSSSTAVTWTRVYSSKTVIDVRGGLNYYHNVTDTEGKGLTTSTDVGIPGANIDAFTAGISTININGFSGPVLGFSASQPWDPDAGRGRTARQFLVQRVGDRQPGRPRVDHGRGELVRVVPARLAEHRAARPEGVRSARNEAPRPRQLRAGQRAGAAEHHRRHRAPLGVLLSACRHCGQRVPCELRSVHAHHPGGGIRRLQRCAQCEAHVHAFRAAHRDLVASRREVGGPRGLRRELDSVPRQPLRVQLSRQAELQRIGRQRIPERRVDGRRLPGACAAGHSVQRHRPDRRDGAPECDPRRDPGRPAGPMDRATRAGRSSRRSTGPARRGSARTSASRGTTACSSRSIDASETA